MSELVLSAEQSRVVADAKGPIMVRTASGAMLGILEPMSPVDQCEIEEVQARLGRPHRRYTTAQVLEKLQSSGN